MSVISFDLIIITRTMDEELQFMCQRTIDSCIDGIRYNSRVNVIVVETSDKICKKYQRVDKMIHYKELFMYNRALNRGIEQAISDFHILANNDLVFLPGWDAIGPIMKENKYLSASAMSEDKRQANFQRGPFAYEGYIIGKHLTGWCIFIDHDILQIIEKLPEIHEFWYSDNDYAAQLRRKGIKHALIACCQVNHVTSATLNKIDRKTRKHYTSGP